MADYEARCRLLQAENEELRERVDQLEKQLGVCFDAPAWLGLTGCEAKVFGLLLAREAVTKAMVMDAIYGGRPDADAAEPKIVDVWICKLRAKLWAFEIEIGTNWGQGYFIAPEMKAKAQALIGERAAA